jgi:transposase
MIGQPVSEEPCAGNPHARIRGGTGRRRPVLPDHPAPARLRGLRLGGGRGDEHLDPGDPADRSQALPPARRRGVWAVCVDMWEPFRLSLQEHLPHARLVYDKFHVLRHASEALDETRRAEFFRQGATARGLVRGKRWLLLRSWAHLDRADRQTLRALFALNRRLAKAHLLKEQLAQLWSYRYPGAARRFLTHWLQALRWQRLPAFRKLGELLTRHLEGILNYCHEPVPFGKVEAINGNIRAMLRRGRGYRDHEYLLLKVQRATATRRHQAA